MKTSLTSSASSLASMWAYTSEVVRGSACRSVRWAAVGVAALAGLAVPLVGLYAVMLVVLITPK